MCATSDVKNNMRRVDKHAPKKHDKLCMTPGTTVRTACHEDQTPELFIYYLLIFSVFVNRHETKNFFAKRWDNPDSEHATNTCPCEHRSAARSFHVHRCRLSRPQGNSLPTTMSCQTLVDRFLRSQSATIILNCIPKQRVPTMTLRGAPGFPSFLARGKNPADAPIAHRYTGLGPRCKSNPRRAQDGDGNVTTASSRL